MNIYAECNEWNLQVDWRQVEGISTKYDVQIRSG